jgi:hypothetical protein
LSRVGSEKIRGRGPDDIPSNASQEEYVSLRLLKVLEDGIGSRVEVLLRAHLGENEERNTSYTLMVLFKSQ